MRELAASGLAEGHLWVGICLFLGLGCQKNHERSQGHLEKAAALGQVQAHLWLGRLYSLKPLTTLMGIMSVSHWQRAMDYNPLEAGLELLGFLGDSSPQYRKRAVKLAHFLLGRYEKELPSAHLYLLGSVLYASEEGQDREKGWELIEGAARDGHPQAMHLAGKILTGDMGLSEERGREGLAYLYKAIEANAEEAFIDLGPAAHNFESEPQRAIEALERGLNSAQKPDIRAECAFQLGLGLACAFNGRMASDSKKALSYFQKAAECQHDLATAHLMRMQRNPAKTILSKKAYSLIARLVDKWLPERDKEQSKLMAMGKESPEVALEIVDHVFREERLNKKYDASILFFATMAQAFDQSQATREALIEASNSFLPPLIPNNFVATPEMGSLSKILDSLMQFEPTVQEVEELSKEGLPEALLCLAKQKGARDNDPALSHERLIAAMEGGLSDAKIWLAMDSYHALTPEKDGHLEKAYDFGREILELHENGLRKTDECDMDAFLRLLKIEPRRLPLVYFLLGTFYFFGLGTKRDKEKAKRLFQKGAQTGNFFAKAALGCILSLEDDKDYLDRALAYLKETSDLGYEPSMINLSKLIMTKEEVPWDESLIKELALSLSSSLTLPSAMLRSQLLLALYVTEQRGRLGPMSLDPWPDPGISLRPEAYEFLKRQKVFFHEPNFEWQKGRIPIFLHMAAETKDAPSAFLSANLDMLFGSEEDNIDGIRILKTLAVDGHSFAQFRLGEILYLGIDRKGIDCPGATFFKEAAGNRLKYCFMGKVGPLKTVLPREETTAYDLFEQAAEQNHPGAMLMQAGMLYAGEGREKDPKKAKEILERLADLGYREGQALLSSIVLREIEDFA
jgi:TPR repeat protein